MCIKWRCVDDIGLRQATDNKESLAGGDCKRIWFQRRLGQNHQRRGCGRTGSKAMRNIARNRRSGQHLQCWQNPCLPGSSSLMGAEATGIDAESSFDAI
jgi:hypothetical protein